LNAQGKSAEAVPLFQKALDSHRKIQGEDHPDTAQGYNNLATSLADQGKDREAGPLFQKTLDIRRKVLGESYLDTANSYTNVAFNLHALGKYTEALESLERATRSDETARLGLTPRVLKHADSGPEHSPHAFLAAARSRAGRAAEAWAALEADLG